MIVKGGMNMNRRTLNSNQLYRLLLVCAGLALAVGLSLWPAQALAEAEAVHVVQRGETLNRIAGQYGTTWREIAEYNNLSNPNRIYVGQQLEIPAPGAVPVQEAPRTIPAPDAPSQTGQVILISLSDQHMWAYDNGELQVQTVVTTGRAGADTPTGTFEVIRKYSPYRFISPYPRGHEFWYEPATANYSLRFTWRGHHIHDSPWRADYGPGTNVPHTDSLGRAQDGSIGCVNVPTAAMAQLYEWVNSGATIVIRH
jgi:LysM repeat protein